MTANERRAAFLAGEGTLTVEEVRQWAGQLGLDYELDGCKDPTPTVMVTVADPAPLSESAVRTMLREFLDEEEAVSEAINTIRGVAACSVCGRIVPVPVELHHSEEECIAEQGAKP